MASELGPVEREVGLRCEMTDGTVLVADAWRPTGEGPWPVLLQRLPYGRSVASTVALPHPSWFAAHGFLVVVQDVRGRGDSEGEFSPFVNEGSDGVESIEWAASLPGSSGDVCMYGFSYQGLVQLYAAAERPPSLRAVAPMMCAPDPYEGWTYEGGALRWPFVCFWAAQLQGHELGTGPIPYDVEALPKTTALGDAPPTWFEEWLGHPDGSDEYWDARRPDLAAIDVPAFVLAGWFDDFSSATLRVAQELDAELLVGPWSHIPWGTRAGEIELGDEASPAAVGPLLVDFFERSLGADRRPAPSTTIYTHGVGWETVPTWPPALVPAIFHSESQGNANSRHGDGSLKPDPPMDGASDVIVVQPLFPYPGDQIPLSDEGPAEDRRDVCCYTSDPFKVAETLTGSPVAMVSVRCDHPGFDVVASLVLIDREDPPRRLCTGIRRVDGSNEATIELRPISWVIPAGARLRLDVSGARFPAFDRNPDTAVATLEILAVELSLPLRPQM